MAPLDPDATARSNTKPLALFGAQVLLVAGLTTNILLTTRRAAKTLPIPSSTRAQEPVRRYHVALFAILAIASLASVTTFSVAWRALSYFEWAEKGNHETPGSLWNGWYGTGEEGVGRWRLGDWFGDVNLARDADVVAINTPEAFVYTSQHFVGLVATAIFMGIEGARRNLPTTTTIAFVLLSAIGSLGFALNLFFVTMLYTPVSLHSDSTPRRDALFAPKPIVFWVPIVASFLLLHSMPSLSESGADIAALRAGYFALPFLLAFAPRFIPAAWGTHHTSKVAAHQSYAKTFYVLGLISFALHWRLLGANFWNNTPPEQASVYDLFMNAIGKHEHKSNRFLTGLGNTTEKLKIVSRHPAISVTGSDVFFTTVSLCAWAFVRNLDVVDMLNNSILSFVAPSEKSDAESPEKHVAFKEDVETTPPPIITPRKRGRPKKNGGATPSAPATSSSYASSLRRSSRRKTKSDYESDMEDSYEPTQETKHEVAETEADGSSTQEELVQGGETAALALALAFAGGLGQLAAGVLGAEVTSSSSV